MTLPFDPRALAREMKAAQDGALPLTPFSTRFPDFDLPAAYGVSQLIHELRLTEGATPVGRKIGFTNPDMWARYGVTQPIWAYVYAGTVSRLTNGRGRCALGRFVEPKIEPEIIFHFRAAPPVGGGLAAILSCIDWVAHGFEIVQSHCPGWRFQAADTVADWALHATLLVGEPQPVSELGANLIAQLESFLVELSCDGISRETGRGSNVLGSPLAAIAHLIKVLDAQPGALPLQAGELVTTGTITTAQTIHAGETWSTRVEGISLPAIAVEFTT